MKEVARRTFTYTHVKRHSHEHGFRDEEFERFCENRSHPSEE